jgi:nickel/cobalt transporter (NiCoT) family protein
MTVTAATPFCGYGMRAAIVIVTVTLLQLTGWSAVALVYHQNHTLLALSGMAYVLGLRHALDADHIAAIDNASRNIAGRGERAAGVGLFFALGHSSVVIVTTLVVAIAATRVTGVSAHLRELAALYSTFLSVVVLFLVAPRNILAAVGIYKTMKHGPATGEAGGAPSIGLLARLLRPLLRLRVQSWHMLLIGILFGLGFETATAISVLALAGAQSGSGATIGTVMIIPLLFMAGMTLVDASDGLFMERAYGWALRNPMRHAVYNLIVTSLSALVALTVGSIELTAVMHHLFGDGSARSSALEYIDAHFDLLGGAIIVTFAVIWMIARVRAHRASAYPPDRLGIEVVS